jgi:hypothetical protein
VPDGAPGLVLEALEAVQHQIQRELELIIVRSTYDGCFVANRWADTVYIV